MQNSHSVASKFPIKGINSTKLKDNTGLKTVAGTNTHYEDFTPRQRKTNKQS